MTSLSPTGVPTLSVSSAISCSKGLELPRTIRTRRLGDAVRELTVRILGDSYRFQRWFSPKLTRTTHSQYSFQSQRAVLRSASFNVGQQVEVKGLHVLSDVLTVEWESLERQVAARSNPSSCEGLGLRGKGLDRCLRRETLGLETLSEINDADRPSLCSQMDPFLF